MVRWEEIENDIASCNGCTARWPSQVCRPLSRREIPNPPKRVKLLFVGVAPTPHEGQSSGGHFYTSAADKLRVGVFRLLSNEPFDLSLSSLPLEEGSRRFVDAGLFFLRAAKVRPIRKLSPPHECIRYCARRHLGAEIEYIAPGAVCFIGLGNAAPAAEELFGAGVGWEPQARQLHSWSGLVALAPQPIRGHEVRTKMIVKRLLAG